MHAHSLSGVRLHCIWSGASPWTATHQAPPSLEFSLQENWNGFPFPPTGNYPDSGVKSIPPASPVLAGRFFTT